MIKYFDFMFFILYEVEKFKRIMSEFLRNLCFHLRIKNILSMKNQIL